MDIQDTWERALKTTEIIRMRLQPLLTFAPTDLAYIFLSESSVNLGDTTVRKGKVKVEKPSIILPYNLPQFDGFDFENELHINPDSLTNFLLVRGITLPSFKYDNQTYSVDIYEGKLKQAIEYYSDILRRQEDMHTGLVIGEEDCWQFSVLIFVASMASRQVEGDIKKILEEFKKRRGFS